MSDGAPALAAVASPLFTQVCRLVLGEGVAPSVDQDAWWAKNRLDGVQWHWALNLFDAYVRQGSACIAWAQRALGMTPSGMVDDAFLAAITDDPADAQYQVFVLIRVQQYLATAPADPAPWLLNSIQIVQMGEHPQV